ncbi:hypothetical protein AGMMS49921_04500 [Endomicrobiia bacterium]|nr:hypothetical protein AGMMS49921_04500 [Endomicrobiia bacterium]
MLKFNQSPQETFYALKQGQYTNTKTYKNNGSLETLKEDDFMYKTCRLLKARSCFYPFVFA